MRQSRSRPERFCKVQAVWRPCSCVPLGLDLRPASVLTVFPAYQATPTTTWSHILSCNRIEGTLESHPLWQIRRLCYFKVPLVSQSGCRSCQGEISSPHELDNVQLLWAVSSVATHTPCPCMQKHWNLPEITLSC